MTPAQQAASEARPRLVLALVAALLALSSTEKKQ